LFGAHQRLHRISSFRVAELPISSVADDPTASEFLASGATFNTSVPLSVPRFVTSIMTDGSFFGHEGILLGKTHSRSFSCRASSHCQILVISSDELLLIGKSFPEFVAELKSDAALRCETVINAKRTLAATIHDKAGSSASVIPVNSAISLELFPSITEIIAQHSTAQAGITHNILPSIYVNGTMQLRGEIPQAL
jgi:hypothetical protein